jgi:hypothetical protein
MTKTTPYKTLDKTYNLFEEIFTREKSLEKKLIFEIPLSKNGEYLICNKESQQLFILSLI